MDLPTSRTGREFKKFTDDGSGNTAVRVKLVGGTISSPIIDTFSSRSGAGAIAITRPACKLTTTGANALTLADGTDGQRLRIIMIVDGGDGTLTPTTKTGYTTITFNDAGDSVDLEFVTTYGWIITGSFGVTIA